MGPVKDMESGGQPRAGHRSLSRKDIKFTQVDWGWIVMSIGMAIGAGIVFLPVEVGMMGIWVFLLSALIGFPALFIFQKLYINSLAEADTCKDYSGVISEYLGKDWGAVLGVLYFLMLIIWLFVYSEAVTNDSASYLHTFGITKTVWSKNPLYGLSIIIFLVYLGSKGEKLLFKVAGGSNLSSLHLRKGTAGQETFRES